MSGTYQSGGASAIPIFGVVCLGPIKSGGYHKTLSLYLGVKLCLGASIASGGELVLSAIFGVVCLGHYQSGGASETLPIFGLTLF